MKYYFYLLIIACFCSCKNNSQTNDQDPGETKEQRTKMNRSFVENESREIDAFISRHYFKTIMTGTGLRYEIYGHGSGNHPAIHNEVELKYKSYLLDGPPVYSSASCQHSAVSVRSAGRKRCKFGIARSAARCSTG